MRGTEGAGAKGRGVNRDGIYTGKDISVSNTYTFSTTLIHMSHIHS